MDEVKKAAEAVDDPTFFHLWVGRDGGLNYELSMRNAPRTVAEAMRTIGAINLTCWQVLEWLSTMIRANAHAADEEEARLRGILEAMGTEGAPIN